MAMRQVWFSANTLDRATDAEADDRVEQDREHSDIWWVSSDRVAWVHGDREHERRYRVQTDYRPGTDVLTWITCTCSHGRNVGAGRTRCYHAAAVLMRIKRLRDETAGPIEGEAK